MKRVFIRAPLRLNSCIARRPWAPHHALCAGANEAAGQQSRGAASQARSIDADIEEMNAEMAELFGAPLPPAGPMEAVASMRAPPPPPDTASLPGSAAGEAYRPSAAALLPADPSGTADVALHALRTKIRWCAEQLLVAQDARQSTQLARCIAECARAADALRPHPPRATYSTT